MSRTRGSASLPANRHAATVIDYGRDTAAEARVRGLMAMNARAMQGHTGSIYVGDVGAPGRAFFGAIGHAVQHFAGLAGLVAQRPTYREGPNTISEGLPDAPYAAPQYRMFAQQLRARRR